MQSKSIADYNIKEGRPFKPFKISELQWRIGILLFRNLGKDLRDNLIGQGLLIFGNILKHNFADIQGNGWKILRNIGWSIYTTKAFWQHFPLMRWKKFCHISKICLKLLIILMLQKKSRVYKAVKKKMAYCRNLTFEQ